MIGKIFYDSFHDGQIMETISKGLQSYVEEKKTTNIFTFGL